jgi:phosphotriesterase-related protein
MASVESVGGSIDVDELGLTLIHEHLRFRDEAVRFQWPHAYDEQAEYDAALADAKGLVGHGVKTVADPAAMFGGRDVEFSRRVADEAGIQVILCTGIYTYGTLPHYFDFRDADMVAELFVHDIEEGIQGTDVKAAFLKCACDEPGMNDNVEKVHRAVARASNKTGAPIMAHSRPASNTGPEQLRIFEEEGVDPAKIQIAHTGDSADLDYIEGLLERGCWIGMDRYGLDMFLPLDERNATLLALLERGYADRMFLSQDYCSTIDWFPPHVEEELKPTAAPKWSMTLLFDEVIAELKERGMTDEQLDTMLVENPKRWLGR